MTTYDAGSLNDPERLMSTSSSVVPLDRQMFRRVEGNGTKAKGRESVGTQKLEGLFRSRKIRNESKTKDLLGPIFV